MQKKICWPRKGVPVKEATRYRPTVRTHDLRHNYASYLASNDMPLHTVGKLLGHTQVSTTMRYAHLQNKALRAATNRFGDIFDGKKQRILGRNRRLRAIAIEKEISTAKTDSMAPSIQPIQAACWEGICMTWETVLCPIYDTLHCRVFAHP